MMVPGTRALAFVARWLMEKGPGSFLLSVCAQCADVGVGSRLIVWQSTSRSRDARRDIHS